MAIISLKDVSLIRNKQHILENINWHIEAGQHWVVFGPNGSGKTMLLKVINGYEWQSSGTVRILGETFGDIDIRTLRKSIGWVSSDLQERMQQHFKAKDVVLSGYFASIGLYDTPSKEVVKKADEVLNFVGCSELADREFPLLSFGEQKKVLIARSLMHDPKLLVLDESCTGLDLAARETFLTFIEELCHKKNAPTLIFVTHHIEEVIPSMTHVLCLKKGQIVASGEKERILTSEIISDVLGLRLRITKHGERYAGVVLH